MQTTQRKYSYINIRQKREKKNYSSSLYVDEKFGTKKTSILRVK